MKKSGRLFLGILFAVVFLLFLAGCNDDSSSSGNSSEKSSMESTAEESSASTNPSGDSASGGDDATDVKDSKDPAKQEESSEEDEPDKSSTDENKSDEDEPDKSSADGNTADEPSAAKGTLALYLTDATTNYKAVYVTIAEVQVHMSGSSEEGEDEIEIAEEGEDEGEVAEEGDTEGAWLTVAEPGQTYNLLELVNGVMAQLGTTELETGHYTMLRMILGENPDEEDNLLGFDHPYPNYIITGSDEEIPLFVPSGYQTGIKLVSGFEIVAGASTELVLDFDASRSVVKAGRSGKYLLKPTIKVVDYISRADVNGIVNDPDGEGLPGAIVSAQVYNPGDGEAGIDPTVEIFTSTQTDEAGNYRLFLPPGDYNIVAYKGPEDGMEAENGEEGSAMAYGPGCNYVETDYNFDYTENFALETNETGTLEVTIEILPELEQTVSINAWKIIDCDGMNVPVQLPPSLNVTAEEQIETHDMILPGGSYTILAAAGETVLRENVEIVPGEYAFLTFNFIGEDTSGENGEEGGDENGEGNGEEL